MELRFDKEIEKLKNCSDLQEFFEIKREILHKIADYIGGSEELHKQIDETYTNIPDSRDAKEMVPYAAKTLIRMLQKISKKDIHSIRDIPIWSYTCPFCLIDKPWECTEFCDYGKLHGYCDRHDSDWQRLQVKLYMELSMFFKRR